MPMLDGKLRTDDRGASVGSIIDNFQQILACTGLKGSEAPVVECQYVELGELRKATFVRAVGASDF